MGKPGRPMSSQYLCFKVQRPALEYLESGIIDLILDPTLKEKYRKLPVAYHLNCENPYN